MTLDTYRDAVHYMAKNNDSFIFRNESKHHAAVVLNEIVSFSKSEVVIYDRKIDGDITNESHVFLDSIRQFLDHENSLLQIVLLEVEQNDTFDKYKKLADEYDGFGMFEASTQYVENLKKFNKNQGDFTIGDGKMFRIEENNESRQAICSFNQPKFIAPLLKLHSDNLHSCKKL